MAGTVKKTVEFYYDVVSPYSWIAFEVLCRYQNKWNIDLKFRPFLLGAVFHTVENRAPMLVPAKGQYLFHDIHRLGIHFKIPFRPQSNFPEFVARGGSLQAQRFLTAVNMKSPELMEELSRQFWLLFWSQDQDIRKPEILIEGGKRAGMSDDQINETLAAIKEQTVKDKLKQTTQEALDFGAFGAPTIVAEDEKKEKHMIFGSDRFHILADILGEKYEGPMLEASKL